MVEGSSGAVRLTWGVNLDYPAGPADTLEMSRDGHVADVPLRGSWFTEAFEGPMSNLQRFVAGEDTALVELGGRRDQDDGARRGVLRIERSRRRRRSVRALVERMSARSRRMIDTHQHFWRYSAAEYSVDRRHRWRRCGAISCRRTRRVRWRAAGLDACVAVQVRQTLEETRWLLELAERAPVHCRRRRVGRSAGRRSSTRSSKRLAAHPKLVGIRHIVQAEPDGFLLGRAFRRGMARLERHGLTYDILVYARHLPAAVGFAAAFPRPAVRAGSSRQAGHPGNGHSTSGGGISTGWPRFPNVCASCRAS